MTTTAAIPRWTLGDRLRKARLHAGYRKAEDVAKVLGVSLATLTSWERDAFAPRDRTAVVEWLADLYEVDRDWLLGRRG